jgi:hypothetical protein
MIQRWFRAKELPVNTDKTELVLFTMRKKVDGFTESVLLDR